MPSRSIRTAAVAALLVLLTGCSDDPTVAVPSPTPPSGTVDQAEADGTVAGLCDMAELGRGRREELNAIFFDRSHEGLHRIAADVQEDDRAAAAVLLERKQLVEQDLLADPVPASFHEDLRELIDATGAALRSAGLRAPACGS